MLKKLDLVSRAGLWLASLALVAIMMVIVVDVCSRHLLSHPIRGAYDMVSIFLLIMIFSGMASVVAGRAEILIDIVDGVLPVKAVHALKILASALTVLACVYLLVAMASPALAAYRYGDRSLELGLPVWTLWVFAYFGMTLVLIVAVARTVDDVRGDRDPESTTP